MDLPHWGHQHKPANGRHQRGYRPMLYVTIEALRPLPSFALSFPMAEVLKTTLLVS